jgi:hypothetical protein
MRTCTCVSPPAPRRELDGSFLCRACWLPIDLSDEPTVTVARLDNAGAIHDPRTCQHPKCQLPW